MNENVPAQEGREKEEEGESGAGLMGLRQPALGQRASDSCGKRAGLSKV